MGTRKVGTWKGVVLASIIATALALVGARTVLTESSDTLNPVEQSRPLRIGVDMWLGYYPILLAEELGYLREADIPVAISVTEDSDRMFAAFAAGEYDIVGVSLADAVTLTRARSDLRVLLITDESTGADGVLSIHPILGPDSIRGKRIGTNFGGFGEVFLDAFLNKHGVLRSEVTLIDTEASDVPAALSRGLVDIAHTWEPYVSQAQAQGANLCFTTRETPKLVLDAMLTTAETRERFPGQLQRLTTQWFRALEYWQEHPDLGNAILEKRLGLKPGEISTDGVKLLGLEDNRKLFGANGKAGEMQGTAELYIEFFVDTGVLTRRPPLAQLIDGGDLP